MNNIYKVIWSKAKNCYVVASEIARSHTKSASGSEKIGGVTRRSLLASLMALSLLCGGLGVASAANSTVHVDESASGAAEVYTKTGVDTLLNDYGKKTDVEDNKNNIAALQTKTTEQGQSIATNVANIANNTKAIERKIDTDMANERFAAKADLTALQNQVTGKVDENTFKNALGDKADTDLGNLTDAGKAAIKNAMSEDMNAITTKVNEEKKDRELKDAELSGRIDTLSTTVDSKVSKTDLNTNYYTQAETNAAIKTAVDDEKNARENAINGEVTERNKAIADAIAWEETNRDAAITNAKTELKEKVTAEETNRKEEDAKLEGKITENTNAINNEKTAREAAVTDLSKRIGMVDEEGQYIKKSATNNVSENLKVLDNRAKTNADAIAAEATERKNKDTELEKKITKNSEDIATLDGKVTTNINDLKAKDTELEGKIKTNADDIAATNKRTAGIDRIDAKKETTIEGNVTVDSLGNVTAQGKLKGEVVDAGAVNAGSLSVENASTLKGDVTMNQKLSVTGDTSLGKTDVGGALNVTGASNLQDNVILGTNAANTVTVNGKSDFKAAVEMENGLTVDNGLTVKNGDTKLKDTTVTGNLNVTGTITTDTMIFGDKPTNYTEIDKGHITSKNAALAGDATQQSSSMEFDRTKLEVGVADKDSNGHLTMTADKTTIKNSDLLEKNYSEIVADKDSVRTTVKDEKNNTTSTKSSATEIRNYAGDAAGNKTINVQTATQNKSWAKDKDGNESSIVQTGKDITNTAEKGTITSKAKDIVNDASGNISNKSQTMDTTVTGRATESYGELETTVTGQATENFNGGLNTNVKGTENHTVTGNQNIHVTGNQTNKIDVDQENTIGGKQTTTATDINRNASSGMIDTIDNDYGTNTETKVAGKTTTDVSIKGTGEKGQYIRGANESRDYLIKGTLKNSETKTVEATSTEITDGNGKTSATIQDVNNLAGSVTNGTETGVSGIHANNDGSVSIDSAVTDVTDGNKYSVINQKKGSIQSTVVDGTNSTVILQDKDNVTIASSNGTVAIGGKDIVNNAQNTITNTAGTKITDKVGTNTRVIDSTSITDTVGTANRKIEDGKIIDTAGDFTVTTENGNGTTFAKKTGSTAYSTEVGAPTDTNIAGNHITTGRVDANELGVSDKDGDNTSDFSVEAGVGKGVKASAGDGTTTGSLDVTAKEVGSSVKDNASGKGSTFKQRIDAIMGNVKTADGESEVTQKGNEITSKVGLGEATNSRVTQKKNLLEAAVTDGTNYNISNDTANASAKVLSGGTKVNKLQDNLYSSEKTITNGTYTTSKLQTALDITNTAKDGTITNDAKNIVNNASGNMTNTVGGDLKTTVAGNELHEVTGTKTENVTGKVTENYGNGQETNVTGDQYLHVTGKQTNKIDGDQENIIGGNQTTTVTGDISNKAENITNEASNSITDKVGENTRVLDSEGITDTVGGSTFKQRIDKIMMESKDVSIKAEETLTNEAKVITNKASEVINNEAVNINNTATGIITSKASEIKNQADKLISNKVGENTWENMENGKITTSIKDGAKQNLTQSDAAGTTQSTVDGGKSTVTIQNADGLADAVTDGTNTSVQNQTASVIVAAVKDGAGNENASVANATTSVNTIKSGSKANTVISTADGTSFINSEAAAPVGDGTEVKTTIKGNTITTGKVTMDYAEVMKDLGVRGSANITGKTTTGSLEVTGTSTLKGDVTMESNATVKKDLTVEGNTNLKNTKVDGTLDVTQKATFGDSVSIAKDLSVDGNATIKGDVTAKSYKVGDKTYISAAGINANDQKITNVADGNISEGSKDAVNGGQLYTVKNDLEGKVNKVGANAAAMANLHPMEFDPDSKWNIAAAIGNYGSETAAALGAFYRPNDDVMVNLSTAFGTGENMVGGGVSVRLGKGGNKLSREENNALKDQVNDLTARMDALLSVLNPNMSKDFPDVPENHWAYEAVSRLAGNDIVQGYPDGEFHGERTMTRYEMAEIIYNALSRGAEAEKELVEEFKPELQAMAASEKATAEKAEG